MSALKSGAQKVYNAINMTRWVISNTLFFGFLALIVLLLGLFAFVMFQSPTLQKNTTLIVNLEGNVVEQYSASTMGRALRKMAGAESNSEQRLFDIIAAIGFAKSDPNISQLYIKTDGMNKIGFAQAREIVRAIQSFKESKKPVVAFGQSFNQKQYLIASSADQVYMDPEGSVTIEGLSQYRQYYREALQDKLGVNIQLFKVGKFKSAAEPYVLDAASPQSKEADLYWMNDLWERYLSDISKNRNVSVEQLKNNIINSENTVVESNGDLPKIALQQKLVDHLATEEDVENSLEKSGSRNPLTKNIEGISSDYYYSMVEHIMKKGGNKIAVVVAEGEIVDGAGAQGEVGGNTTAERLAEIRDNKDVKSVVLRVDSPGGSVFASEQIRREIELLKKSGRPVVVSMGNTAASGGYWISMNADKIIADPSTITGSIGIFGMVPDISKALDKIGVHTDGVSTTQMAGLHDITRPLSPVAGRMLQSVIDNGYNKFISKVSNAREISVEQVDDVAQGRVWSGQQAKDRKLVDHLGGLQDSLVEARKLAHLNPGEYGVIIVESDGSGMGGWMLGLAQNKMIAHLGKEAGVWQTALEFIPEQSKQDAMWIFKNLNAKNGMKTFAHCFCSLE